MPTLAQLDIPLLESLLYIGHGTEGQLVRAAQSYGIDGGIVREWLHDAETRGLVERLRPREGEPQWSISH